MVFTLIFMHHFLLFVTTFIPKTGFFKCNNTGGPFFKYNTGGPFFKYNTGRPFFKYNTGEPFFKYNTGEPFFKYNTGGPFFSACKISYWFQANIYTMIKVVKSNFIGRLDSQIEIKKYSTR